MPYFSNDLEKDQDELNQSQDSQLKLSQGQLGGAQGESGPAKKAGLPQSKFSTLEKFFKANEDNQFGGQFGGMVQGDLTKASQNVADLSGKIKGEINQSGTVATPEAISAAVANPTEANVEQYNKMINAEYKGPKSAMDSPFGGQLFLGAQTGAQTAKAATTMPGRETLLSRYFGRPDYNQGMKSLDAALLGRSTTYNPTTFGDQGKSIISAAKQAEKDIGSLAGERAAQVAKTKELARKEIGIDDAGNVSGGALGGLRTSVDQRLADWNKAQTDKMSGLSSAVSSDEISNEYLNSLGLTGGQKLYNVNLADYLNQGGQATRENMMTPDEFLRELTLEKMAGLTPSFVDPNKQGEAGKAPNQVGFDKERFLSDIGSQSKDYTSQAEALDNEIAAQRSQFNNAKNLIGGGGESPYGQVNLPYRNAMETAQRAIAAAEAKKADLYKKYNVGRSITAKG